MYAALMNLLSAVIGGTLTIIGILIKESCDNTRLNKIDEPRRKLLRMMLDKNPSGWRTMATLSGVIGASPDETARLLIEIGARRNEKESGNDVWGYIKHHPLPDTKTSGD